ncbi:hypothetical protein QYF36_025439 [Acer negundo]|nr:hypothetical protein QYF36_025439 [Acer negundo]
MEWNGMNMNSDAILSDMVDGFAARRSNVVKTECMESIKDLGMAILHVIDWFPAVLQFHSYSQSWWQNITRPPDARKKPNHAKRPKAAVNFGRLDAAEIQKWLQ